MTVEIGHTTLPGNTGTAVLRALMHMILFMPSRKDKSHALMVYRHHFGREPPNTTPRTSFLTPEHTPWLFANSCRRLPATYHATHAR